MVFLMVDEEKTAPPVPPDVGAVPDSSERSRSKWSGRLLSTVCPGLGQIVCGRWVAGVVQMGVFLAALATACVMLVGQLLLAYRAAFAMDTDPQADLPDLGGIGFVLPFVSSLAVALLVAVWSIWDAGKKSGAKRGM